MRQLGIREVGKRYTREEIENSYSELLMKKGAMIKPESGSVWQVSTADESWQRLVVGVPVSLWEEVLATETEDLKGERRMLVDILSGELGNVASAFSAPLGLLRRIEELYKSGGYKEKQGSISEVLKTMIANLENQQHLPELILATRQIVEKIYWPQVPQEERRKILGAGREGRLQEILARDEAEMNQEYGFGDEKIRQYAWMAGILFKIKAVTEEFLEMQKREPFKSMLTVVGEEGEVVAGVRHLEKLDLGAVLQVRDQDE